MLERAVGCLKAGARDSLKCAAVQCSPSTAPSSRFLHHHSLSTHGACDGVFLDFLYPPRALAWLHGVHRPRTNPRRGHSGKRRMGGLTQPSRRYISQSPLCLGKAKEAREPRGKGHSHDDLDFLKGLVDDSLEDTKGANEWIEFDRLPDAGSASGELLPKKSKTALKPVGSSGLGATSNSADTAADLTERNIGTSFRTSPSTAEAPASRAPSEADSDEPSSPHRILRRKLGSSSAQASLEHITAVWSFYLSLPVDDKSNIKLKERLLEWFSDSDEVHASAFCISLFWTVSMKQRTLSIYHVTCKALMRQGLHDSALALHDEALKSIPNGLLISLTLFKLAARKENWPLALSVVDQHQGACASRGHPEQHELLWLKIAELPDLFDLASSISKMDHDLKRLLQPFAPSRIRLIEEAVRKHMQPVLPKEPKDERARLYDMLQSLSIESNRARLLFAELLSQRIGLIDRCRIRRPHSFDAWTYPVVSYMYLLYRQLEGARLPEHQLESFLRYHRYYVSNSSSERLSPRSVNVDTILLDWQRWHGKLNLSGVELLLDIAAENGDVERSVHWIGYLERNFSYHDWKRSFHQRIRIHARRGDLEAAKKAFNEARQLARENNDELQVQCWDVLIHAHERVDDLEGGLAILKGLVDTAKLTPTSYSFQPLMLMTSRRGDVIGTQELLKQFDMLAEGERHVPMLACLISAFCRAGNVQKAEELLSAAVVDVHRGRLVGSLTQCFNIVIAKYASMRDINAVMRIYRWMRETRIRLDGQTYGHLMQALVNFGQTNAAWALAKSALSREGLRMGALHYSIAMEGFYRNKEYDKVLTLQKHMETANVKPNISTRRVYLRTKAVLDNRARNDTSPESVVDAKTLEEVMKELEEAKKSVSDRELATRERHISGASSRGSMQDLYDPIMTVLGGRESLNVVQELFRKAKDSAKPDRASLLSTIRLSTRAMHALRNANEHGQLEEMWKVVKAQADAIAPLAPIPDLRSAVQGDEPATTHSYRLNSPIVENRVEDDRAEVGFPDATNFIATSEAPQPPAVTPVGEIVGPLENSGPRPAPARRFILSHAFKVYLASLVAQNRMADAVSEFTSLTMQGYTFDNGTWNTFIQQLCRAEPPLALLAFSLTERYLMRNFPGWYNARRARRYSPVKSDVRLDMQYIQARYLATGELMPKYQTMVYLARALLDVQQMDASGWAKFSDKTEKIDLRRFVGTIKQIRERAPRTVEAVRRMPRVNDRAQTRILRESHSDSNVDQGNRDDESLDVNGAVASRQVPLILRDRRDANSRPGGEDLQTTRDFEGQFNSQPGSDQEYKPFGTDRR